VGAKVQDDAPELRLTLHHEAGTNFIAIFLEERFYFAGKTLDVARIEGDACLAFARPALRAVKGLGGHIRRQERNRVQA
jgi:hypothetical protein